MAEENKKEINELKLHEEVYIIPGVKVIRVPGGLIYTHIHSFNDNMKTLSQSISTTFVPFDFKDGKTWISKPSKGNNLNFGG